MKIQHVAMMVTAIVIVAGFAMISPLFFRVHQPQTQPTVMLSFSVSQSGDVTGWCQDLAKLLDNYQIGASLFLVGQMAEEYPDAVGSFDSRVDIGSQTYDYVDLTSIADYSVKLEEVKAGKTAVDDAGRVNSKIFRAPFGATDQDIYSLLSRNGILADFSYENQYNVYRDGLFIKYDAITYQSLAVSQGTFAKSADTTRPVIIYFDNNQTISEIMSVISSLKESNVKFVNASELTGIILTERRM